MLVGSLGLTHLVWTFVGTRFHPRDSALEAEMRRVSPVLTRQTTMWSTWVGFNASHSAGALLFALIYGYLALRTPGLLFSSAFLLATGAAYLGGMLVLAVRFWFSKPRNGVAIALALYVAGALWELTS
jgi:hypothetical protein